MIIARMHHAAGGAECVAGGIVDFGVRQRDQRAAACGCSAGDQNATVAQKSLRVEAGVVRERRCSGGERTGGRVINFSWDLGTNKLKGSARGKNCSIVKKSGLKKVVR